MQFAWFCILFPFCGAAAVLALGRANARLRDAAAVLFPFLAALSSLALLPSLLHPETLPAVSAFTWLSVPFTVELGVLLDPLSIILAVVVAVISFIITVYCLGYMKGDPGITRFWALVNLFIGSMLLLVLADNLLLLFVGWKLVGLCSYALIGYYYHDEKKYWIGGPAPAPFIKPTHAGLKALIMTGFGDMVMLGGIMIIFYYAGTFNLMNIYRTSAQWIPEMAQTPGMIILVSFLLLAGPVGKSAQFPLHEWLPEAMAGPGPVSALIHAATMVKSGVYLVARLIPVFYSGYWVAGCQEASVFFTLTAWIGVITAFIAATQGLVALELKKALAYSTVSQIGYMWIGLGVAGLAPAVLVSGSTAGIFHLVSHAVFKACLFLCAGSVIHAAHSIYMFDMGGMRKHMPYTWLSMLIAAVCLMGLPPLPGFWSKDAVLLASLQAGNMPVFTLAVITVALTAFYTTRLVGMVFYGPHSSHIDTLQTEGMPPHEARATMWGACGGLAILIILLGLLGPKVETLLHAGFQASLITTLQLPAAAAVDHAGSYHGLVTVLSLLAILIGAIPAFFIYIARSKQITILKHPTGEWIHGFLWRRWLIDGFYYRMFVGGALLLSDFISFKTEDRFHQLIHTRLPELVTQRVHKFLLRTRTETENLAYACTYILLILIGALIIALR
ncbi:MAG: NADH-quinone oxidoreductase subunit L [Thermodesulfobacteriota bacterium]